MMAGYFLLFLGFVAAGDHFFRHSARLDAIQQNETSLSIVNGQPVVSHRDVTNRVLTYASFDGTTWQVRIVDLDGAHQGAPSEAQNQSRDCLRCQTELNATQERVSACDALQFVACRRNCLEIYKYENTCDVVCPCCEAIHLGKFAAEGIKSERQVLDFYPQCEMWGLVESISCEALGYNMTPWHDF